MDKSSFNLAYTNALIHVLDNGIWQENQRTGARVLSTFGYSFRWNMNYAPIATMRPMYLRTMAAEVAWMLSGTKDLSWLQKYTTIWDAFAEPDNTVETAYGYRWQHAFKYDQIKNIVFKLRNDESSRQQVLMNWDPRVDNVKQAKNIPCPYSAVFAIIGGKLNCMLTLRSNDILYGFPYDVGMYTMLSQALANELGVSVGDMHYTIAHMHIYENQISAVKTIVNSKYSKKDFHLKHNFTIDEIREDPDHFVAHIVNLQEDLDYKPDNVTKGLLPKVVL